MVGHDSHHFEKRRFFPTQVHRHLFSHGVLPGKMVSAAS